MKPQSDITLIKKGIFFDGTGKKGEKKDILISEGKVSDIFNASPEIENARVIDASDSWVMPGFIDIHTHYDAEVEVMPGLTESIRHGVTTVVMGNCSLSAALGKDTDIVDLFARVENIPAKVLGEWIIGNVSWQNVREYYEHLEKLPVGPNIASFIGHSNLRIESMGLKRSFTEKKANKHEINKMRGLLGEALEEGYLGMSIDMLPFHRWAGAHNPEFMGISVPSQRAAYSEYYKLADVLRSYDRVLQATPNAVDKASIMHIMGMSAGIFRKPLKATIVAALDLKSSKLIYYLLKFFSVMGNDLFQAKMKFQTLAEPFLNYADGPITPLFEEFPTMIKAISSTSDERSSLFRDVGFRKAFQKEWNHKSASVFPKALEDMWIVNAPDQSLIGKSFSQLAKEENKNPEIHFMDLLSQYDTQIRWKCDTANHREKQRVSMLGHKHMLPGFNDTGAHNVNMAFHDGALQTLALAQKYPNELPIEEAISRLTKKTADFIGIDAGFLEKGKRADLTIIDPSRLDSDLTHEPTEHFHEKLNGSMRLVKRSGKVVRNVFVGGDEVFMQNGTEKFNPEIGTKKFGELLRAGH